MRTKLKKQINLKNDSNDDEFCRQVVEQALKEAQGIREENNELYFKLQEHCPDVHFEEANRRMDIVAKCEDEIIYLQQENNRLKVQMSRIMTELKLRGIVFDINFDFICKDGK